MGLLVGIDLMNTLLVGPIGPKLAEHIQQAAENPIDYMRGSYTNSIFLVHVTMGEITYEQGKITLLSMESN